jgi:ADP-dependent NAD(P)H-hydrate dehydratase / NAD(P)H-hydrate epimerase
MARFKVRDFLSIMSVPVITVEEMRRWEAASWAAGCSQAEVIQQAGAAVGRVAARWTQWGDTVVILAGPGNNGADARHAEPELAGRLVRVIDATDPVRALTEVNAALAGRPALLIDGLFGIGLNRPLDDAWVQLIEAVNESRVRILAVDVPSGLNADTGLPQPTALRASVTVTMGAPKAGLLMDTAWPFVGRLEVAAHIGLIPCPIQSNLHWTLAEDFADFPPRRPQYAHKGDFGHLRIIAGSYGYHGAAVLAARGAARAMPGLLTLLTMENVYSVVAAQLQSTMVEIWKGDARGTEGCDGLLFGSGLASSDVTQPFRQRLRRAWHSAAMPVIADATALDWLAPDARRHDFWRIMTPHPGEAARLLNTTVPAVQHDRVGSLRELSRRYSNCLVVLKGHQTLIGTSTGPIYLNGTGNPGLAQGGAGDVLAGFLAGMVMQRRHHRDALTAVRYAVWQHGAAADRLTARMAHWTIEDLVNELGTMRA